MDDALNRAKNLLHTGGYTCVLIKEERTVCCNERGVEPLLALLQDGQSYRGFVAADRIVGRAAAFLYVLLGASSVYADVVSEGGAEILARYGISLSFGVTSPYIVNRKGSGPCPMDVAVSGIEEPEAAYRAILAAKG